MGWLVDLINKFGNLGGFNLLLERFQSDTAISVPVIAALIRLLQISSFNGKMNALNEVNKVIASVSYYTHRHANPEEEDWLTAERVAVLNLLWSLAHSNDVPTDIMDQALNAHVKILDYSCSQDRDSQKTHWLDRCVEELKNDKWVLPALKQIREICNLYSEAPPNFNHAQRSPHMFYRHEVINRLQQHHSLVILVADNLTSYMKKAHVMAKGKLFICSVFLFPISKEHL
ncbi:probable ubiquitin carboxyl-terminal hydrolase FAF-X [Trichonephila clavipes]|nr:probable ubiquitin carboxyl-terminal hydrolase FAF-X [Trichonephila clavipes]